MQATVGIRLCVCAFGFREIDGSERSFSLDIRGVLLRMTDPVEAFRWIANILIDLGGSDLGRLCCVSCFCWLMGYSLTDDHLMRVGLGICGSISPRRNSSFLSHPPRCFTIIATRHCTRIPTLLTQHHRYISNSYTTRPKIPTG